MQTWSYLLSGVSKNSITLVMIKNWAVVTLDQASVCVRRGCLRSGGADWHTRPNTVTWPYPNYFRKIIYPLTSETGGYQCIRKFLYVLFTIESDRGCKIEQPVRLRLATTVRLELFCKFKDQEQTLLMVNACQH